MATAKATKKQKTNISNIREKLTPYQQEQVKIANRINEVILNAEASVVGIIYKNPEKLAALDIGSEDFSNNIYRVYLEIAIGVTKENMALTDINCGIYLVKHERLKSVWDEYGGFKTILDAGAFVDESSFDGFVYEIKKWNAIRQLVAMGFPVSENFSEFSDMSAEDIYNLYEGKLNHVFANAHNRLDSFDAFEGLEELIDEWDKGDQVGMPFGPNENTMMLNEEIGGIRPGNIYNFAGITGAGKSTILINYLMPSIINYKTRCVFIINEEDQTKVKREMLLWCCSNVLKTPVKKSVIRDGGFDDDTKNALYRAAEYLKTQSEEHLLTIIPLETYTADLAIKIIKKYKTLFDVNLFVLDTLKESAGNTDEAWRSILRDSVKLYDTIKPASLNVALIVSMQIAKASMKTKHLTNYDIGMSRNATDVYSVSVLFRRADVNELRGGNKEIKYWVDAGKGSRIEYFLEPIDEKTGRQNYYMIWFFGKNRFGQQDTYSIVTQFDFSTNSFKDLGKCVIPEDL